MKSALFFLFYSSRAEECQSVETDDIVIQCSEDWCFVECRDLSLVPPVDMIECDTSTGQPKTTFPRSCQTASCPTLSPTNSLQINCNAGDERCEFSCLNGLQLIGPSVVYCNQPDDANSPATWSQDQPTCGQSATCESLNVEYAQITCTNGETLGSVCELRCDDDRILSPETRSLTCQYSNNKLTWDVATPVCELKTPLPTDAPDETDPPAETTVPPTTVTPSSTDDTDIDEQSCNGPDENIWTIIKCNQAVVGIGVGVFVIILVIAIGVACCIRKRKQREDEKNQMDHLWETNPTIQRSLRGSSRGESTQDAIVHNNTRTFRENNISEPSGSFYRPNRQAAQYHSRYNQSPHAQANPYSHVQLNPETEPFIYDPSNGTDQNYPVSRGLSKNQNYQPFESGRSQKQSSSNQLSTFFVPNP